MHTHTHNQKITFALITLGKPQTRRNRFYLSPRLPRIWVLKIFTLNSLRLGSIILILADWLEWLDLHTFHTFSWTPAAKRSAEERRPNLAFSASLEERLPQIYADQFGEAGSRASKINRSQIVLWFNKFNKFGHQAPVLKAPFL